MKPIQLHQLLNATNDFRRTWPQLLLTDLLSRIIGIVILTPMIGLLIKLFLLQTDDGVLADTDILLFLLSPFGILSFVCVAAVWLAIVFAKHTVLLVIGFGAVQDRSVTWLESMRYVAGYALGLVNLARHVIVRLLLIGLPFLLGIYLVYRLLLSQHDINFYLNYQPNEFVWAVFITGLLIFILAVIVLRVFAGWIIVIPLILFEGQRVRQSLRQSMRKVGRSGWKITLLLALWFIGIAVVSSFFTFLVGLAGKFLVSGSGTNIVMLASGLGVTLALAGVGNLVIAVISTTLFPLFIVRLYRVLAGPGRFAPDLAAHRPLGARAAFQIPGKAILGLSAAALGLIVLGGYAFSRSIDQETEVAIIAHRGASGAAPENTMAAFERAIEDKADWIELDVQENAEGTVIVAHDSDFMKVAQSTLKIWKATDKDLRSLDIGSWYGPEFSDQRVPTLRQALELAKGKLGVVIELKYYGHDRDLEARVVDIVEQTGMEANIMIMSLKLAGIQKMKALRPDWTRGLLNTTSVGDLTRLDLDFLALNSNAASLAMIRRAGKKGRNVYAWTINHPVQMWVMLSRGVNGIITDEPALARQVLELRKQLTPFGRLVVWIAGESGLLHGVETVSNEKEA